jgi:hypothetical protein
MLEWSPDGTIIALGVAGKGVFFLDAANGAEMGRIDSDDVVDIRGIQWFPDGKSLMTSSFEGLRIWEVSIFLSA